MHSILSPYINSLHSVAGDEHHSASPMGLWLLLAVAATATEPGSAERARVEKVLGLPAEQALCVVEELLGGEFEEEKQSPEKGIQSLLPNSGNQTATDALKAAMALWLRGNSLTELKDWAHLQDIYIDDTKQEQDIYAWRDNLPEIIESSDIPTIEESNQWVKEKTEGLLDTLPIPINERTFLILLSAIATKTKWQEPFHEMPNRGFLAKNFIEASKVLISQPSHRVFVEDTEFGMVGVHVAKGTNGLDVYSVIADPKVDYLDVIRVAHEIAEEDTEGCAGVPLHQLEVEESDIYQVSRRKSSSGEMRTAYLPVWKTTNSLQKLHEEKALGFAHIINSICAKSGLKPEDAEAEVQQDVTAEYTASGFDAAAVSELSMRIGMTSVPLFKEELYLEIPFDHPYAVVAVVRDKSSWTGTPIFSSWVKEVL